MISIPSLFRKKGQFDGLRKSRAETFVGYFFDGTGIISGSIPGNPLMDKPENNRQGLHVDIRPEESFFLPLPDIGDKGLMDLRLLQAGRFSERLGIVFHDIGDHPALLLKPALLLYEGRYDMEDLDGVLSLEKTGKELFLLLGTGLDNVENQIFLLGIILIKCLFGDRQGPANVLDGYIADTPLSEERRGCS